MKFIDDDFGTVRPLAIPRVNNSPDGLIEVAPGLYTLVSNTSSPSVLTVNAIPQGVISFDLDGVLANFTRGFTRIGSKMFGAATGDQPSQTSWIFEDVPELGLSKSDVGHPIKGGGMWAEVIKSPYFWANLDPINVSIMHTIDRIKNKVFITNRLGENPIGQSKTFLERWGVIEPVIYLAADKGPIAQQLNVVAHIDDFFPNCRDIQAAVPDAYVAMLAVPYNVQYRTPPRLPWYDRIRGWQGVPEWDGSIVASVDHFIAECDKRDLIEWSDKDGFTSGSEQQIQSGIKGRIIV